MPRVTFVKKARKDTPVCKAGESYYWWKNRAPGARSGHKRYSKERPNASQTCGNPFFSEVYSIQEDIAAIKAEDMDDLRGQVEELTQRIRDLADEQEEKYNNMPDGLQQSETGDLLQERATELQSWADELENVTIEDPEDDATDEDKADALTNAIDEIQAVDCSL